MAENLDPEVITRLNEEYRKQQESLRDTNLLSEAQNKAKKTENDLTKAGNVLYEGTIQSLKSFTKALTTQETSFQKYTEVSKQLATTAADAAKQMGGVVGAMGSVLKAASQLVNALATQADAVVKTKDQVAKFGAVGALTSEKLQSLANQAGYFSLNMNKLYQAAGKAGGDLLIFSKNMSGGVQTFAEMANVGEKTLQEFNSLGIGADELRESQADYVKYLAASGVQLNASQKTQEALRKGSLEYTRNVLELSALTGKDVDTVKKKQQEAQASLDIQIHYGKLQAQAAELRLAGDKEGAKALEDQIEKEKAIIDKVAATYDAATTAAVRNALATGGSYTELSAALANAGVDVRKLVMIAKDQSLTGGQASAAATEEIARGVQRSTKIFGDSMIYVGDSLGKQVLVSGENLQSLAKGAGEAVKNQDEVARKLANPEFDQLKVFQNAMLATERYFTVKADEAIKGINPFMLTLDDVMKNFKKMMAESWTFIKENVLTPLNDMVKEKFGVDIGQTINSLVATLNELAEAALKLWRQFDGLSGSKLLSKVGDVVTTPLPGTEALGRAQMSWWNSITGGESSSSTESKTRGITPSGGSGTGESVGLNTRGITPSGGSGTGGSLKGNTGGLNPDLQRRLMAAAEVYGKPLTINSGFRSPADQQRLWDESVKAGRTGIGPNGMPVGKPGSSLHEKGMAVDIAEYKDPAAVAALRSQGLMQTVRGDPVHFEVPGSQTAAASGSSSASGTSVQSSPPTTTAMSSSDDNLIRVMIDMRNSLNSKMQEMVDKVAESNGILEKIMRRS
jgi:zinc D-Ala-D-Ala carboxypeptidase